jgi:hypothetical protein
VEGGIGQFGVACSTGSSSNGRDDTFQLKSGDGRFALGRILYCTDFEVELV